MKSRLVLALVVAGCAPDRGAATVYRSSCLEFYAELELNTGAMDHNTALAEEMLTPIVGDFCEAFTDVRVRVRNEMGWQCGHPGNCIGEAVALDEVHVAKPGWAMLHEFLHAWEMKHLVYNPGHSGWDSNGFQAAEDAWTKRWKRLDVK